MAQERRLLEEDANDGGHGTTWHDTDMDMDIIKLAKRGGDAATAVCPTVVIFWLTGAPTLCLLVNVKAED